MLNSWKVGRIINQNSLKLPFFFHHPTLFIVVVHRDKPLDSLKKILT